LTRTLAPERFIRALQLLVEETLGSAYTQTPAFNLELAYRDSSAFIPIIFVLSSGADPRLEIMPLVEKFSDKGMFKQISLGQGQGNMAMMALLEAFKDGRWVLLQNCHLAPSFMPLMERTLEAVPADVHPEFRVWLTTQPCESFPVNILMKSIKLTFQAPRGIRKNLLRSFQSQDRKRFEETSKPY